jgi:hypothetical protein
MRFRKVDAGEPESASSITRLMRLNAETWFLSETVYHLYKEDQIGSFSIDLTRHKRGSNVLREETITREALFGYEEADMEPLRSRAATLTLAVRRW